MSYETIQLKDKYNDCTTKQGEVGYHSAVQCKSSETCDPMGTVMNMLRKL